LSKLDGKERHRKIMVGKLPPNTKSITINNIKYKSQSEAARQLNVCDSTIHYWIKKKINI